MLLAWIALWFSGCLLVCADGLLVLILLLGGLTVGVFCVLRVFRFCGLVGVVVRWLRLVLFWCVCV